MKKVFKLQVENKKPERQLESIKNEVRKYLKRERKKKLPEDAIYWDFECRFGKDEASAKRVTVSEVTTALDSAHSEAWSECYVEILAKASMKKPSVESDDEEESE